MPKYLKRDQVPATNVFWHRFTIITGADPHIKHERRQGTLHDGILYYDNGVAIGEVQKIKNEYNIHLDLEEALDALRLNYELWNMQREREAYTIEAEFTSIMWNKGK